MTRVLRLLFLNEWRYQYPSGRYFAFQALSAYLTLVVYWYTSEALGAAFAGHVQWQAHSYFEFLLLAQLVLALPLGFFDSVVQAVHWLAVEDLLADFLLLPRRALGPVLGLSLSQLTHSLVNLGLLIVMARILFHYTLPVLTVLKIGALVIASIPLFWGLGIFAAAGFLIWGRGQGLLAQCRYLFSIFAGAYFPLTVLPATFASFLKTASPFALLLDSSRELVMSGDGGWISQAAALLGFGVLIFLLSAAAFHWAFEGLRRRPWPDLTRG